MTLTANPSWLRVRPATTGFIPTRFRLQAAMRVVFSFNMLKADSGSQIEKANRLTEQTTNVISKREADLGFCEESVAAVPAFFSCLRFEAAFFLLTTIRPSMTFFHARFTVLVSIQP